MSFTAFCSLSKITFLYIIIIIVITPTLEQGRHHPIQIKSSNQQNSNVLGQTLKFVGEIQDEGRLDEFLCLEHVMTLLADAPTGTMVTDQRRNRTLTGPIRPNHR